MRKKKIYSTNENKIYILRNRCNNKIYIGETWQTIGDRWKSGKGYGDCIYLDNAIKCHGKENFYYEIIAMCSDEETSNYLEDLYIEEFNARNRDVGYNIKRGGSRGRHSKETIQKMSTEEMLKKISRKGSKHSQETIQKMSESRKGKFSGDKNPGAKLNWDKVHEIRRLYNEGHVVRFLAEQFNISKAQAHRIISNEKWTDKDYIPNIRGNVGKKSKFLDNIKLCQEVFEKHHLDSKTIKEISSEYQVSTATIRRIIKKYKGNNNDKK